MLHEIDKEAFGPRGEAVSEAVSKCVHCGFCLPGCPTYQELQSEMDSPRGRILLMKSVLEGELDSKEAQPHIDRCLGCVACVTNCPSGVEYGELISSYRDHVESSEHNRRFSLRAMLVRFTLPYASRFRMAVRTGFLARPFQRWFPPSLRPMLEMLPESLPEQIRLPEITPAKGERRGRVALMAGCAQQVLAPEINASAIRVLSENGVEVVVPPNQGCCGALSWHTGEGAAAKRFAKDLIGKIPADVDAFLTTAAGCGSAVAEYPLLLAGDSELASVEALTAKSMDVSVYLNRLGLREIPALERPKRIAYQDACHLAHAQGVRREPRELLRSIPGVEIVDLRESDTCCGSAGTYNVEQPEIASNLGKRKADAVLASGASAVASGNIGCLVQLEKHLKNRTDRVAILHTVQVLDSAYRRILG
ncbi:MAG: (Fe-S)-binding protein [Pirellulaceae bacterium]